MKDNEHKVSSGDNTTNNTMIAKNNNRNNNHDTIQTNSMTALASAATSIQDEIDTITKNNLCNKSKVTNEDETNAKDTYPTPPPTPNQLRAMQHNPMLKLVHEHVGAFYVYRFELNGKVYYHGTVPNFANPNKKRTNANNAKANKTIKTKQANTYNTNSNNNNNNIKYTQGKELHHSNENNNNNTPLLYNNTATTTTITSLPISTSNTFVQQANKLYNNSHGASNVSCAYNPSSYKYSTSFDNTERQSNTYTSYNTLQSPSLAAMEIPCHTNTESKANTSNTLATNNNCNFPKSIASALFSYNTPSFSNTHHNRSTENNHDTGNCHNTSPSSIPYTPSCSRINNSNVVHSNDANTNVIPTNNNFTNMHLDNTLHQTTSTSSSSPSLMSAALPHSLSMQQGQQQQHQEEQFVSLHGPSKLSQPSHEPVSYLTNRVTSSAVETARRWMRSLYSYAYGAPTRSNNNNNINHHQNSKSNTGRNEAARNENKLSVQNYDTSEIKIQTQTKVNNVNPINYNVQDGVHNYTTNATSTSVSDFTQENRNTNTTETNYPQEQQLFYSDVYKQHQQGLQQYEACKLHCERKDNASTSYLQNNNAIQTSSNMVWSEPSHPTILSSYYYTQEARIETKIKNETANTTMNEKGNKKLRNVACASGELEEQELLQYKDYQETNNEFINNANYNNVHNISNSCWRYVEASPNTFQCVPSQEVHDNSKRNAYQSVLVATQTRTQSYSAASAHSRNSSFTTCESATSHEQSVKLTDRHYRKEQEHHHNHHYKHSQEKERRKRQQSERHCLTLPATYPAHVVSAPLTSKQTTSKQATIRTENGETRQVSLSKVTRSSTASPISIHSPLNPLKQLSEDGEKYVWN